MPETYDLIVRGGEVVNHAGRGFADIGVKDGKFAAIGDLSQAHAGEVFDATGLTVMPGVIDTQVHFREPGLEWKEDLETGSQCAVLGGVVAVFEMPNTEPTTTDPDTLADKLARAKARMHCDHAFYMGGTHENAKWLGELERLPGCCGVKVFMGASTGSLLVQDDAGVEEVLRHINRRAAFHSEDEYRLAERRLLARTGDWTSHPEVRDAQSAIQSTHRLVRIATKLGKRIHVLHVTTRDEIEYLADHKDVASVEVTPQHLTLEGPEAYERLKGFAQMNPPIRDHWHRMGVWAGRGASDPGASGGPDQPRRQPHLRPGRQGPPGRGLRRRPDHRRPQGPPHDHPRPDGHPRRLDPIRRHGSQGLAHIHDHPRDRRHARRRDRRPRPRRAGAVPRDACGLTAT